MVFRRGLKLVKEAVLLELTAGGGDNTLLDGVKKWLPPDCFMDAVMLQEKLVRAAVETAYERYHKWRTHLRDARPRRSALHTRT